MTDLDAIEKRAREARERAEKATAGPWSYSRMYGLATIEPVSSSEPIAHAVEYLKNGDADFIASARTYVPLLADDVIALVEAVKVLQEIAEWHPGYYNNADNSEAYSLSDQAKDALHALAKREAPLERQLRPPPESNGCQHDWRPATDHMEVTGGWFCVKCEGMCNV